MAQDAPVLALSDIMHTMSPSPAPQLIDDSLDAAVSPSSHSPEPLDAAQVEAMRKRAVELSLQGKVSMSAKEKELAIMVLRLTSCSVPDVSQILAQADMISDLTRQRDFLYKEIDEERARWEAERQGFERIAEALIGKRSRGGDSTYREEELERHVAILDADNKALRSKISEYHSRMQTVEAELAQLRPVLLMQPFALTHSVQPHTQPASYTFVGPSYKAERSSKRRKHAQPPPQSTDRDQDATEEEADDAGPSNIATPKQRPQKGDYYRRRDTDVFTEPTKHRRHRPKKGSTMLADARAEHLLLAARKVGKERAAILAGIASGPERDRKKEDDSSTATPRTPKRSLAVPVTGGTMGIMYLNSPAPAPATPSAAPAASTSQPMQTPQPASRTVTTQKAPAPERPAVTNPRTPLDSLLTAARSISMIEDEDDDAEEEEYGEPAAGPSNPAKPLTRGRVAELQGSPVSVKRRRVAAPLTISRSRDAGSAARKDSSGGAGRAEETTRRTRSGLDVLADQAAAAFSSEKDKSTGRGKGKGKARARDVSEAAEGSKAAAGAVNGRRSSAAGMVTRARGERTAASEASGRTQSPASVASGTRKGKATAEDAAIPARRTKAAARTRAPPPEADAPAGPSTSQDAASSASGSASAPPQSSASDSAPRSPAGEAMDVDNPGDTASIPAAASAPGPAVSDPDKPIVGPPAASAPVPAATTPPTTAAVPAAAPCSVSAPDAAPATAPAPGPTPPAVPEPTPDADDSLSAAEDQDAEGEPDTLGE